MGFIGLILGFLKTQIASLGFFGFASPGVTTSGQCEFDNSGWCNKSHKLQPGDLVLNIWPKLYGFYWTASLLSEVLE
jgi:hypothetical protein